MNEPSTTLPSKPANKLIVVLVVLAVLASLMVALTLGILAWWWLRKSNGGAVALDGNRNRPPIEVALFNGTDLTGWEFDAAVWSVRNGVIYGHQKRSGYGSS